VLDQAAADHAMRPAIRMDGFVLSYAGLRVAAARTTSLLAALGIVPGDRVAVMLPNVPAFPIAFYGALGAGAVVVPLNPLLESREVAHCLRDSGARVMFAWHAVAVEAGNGAAETGTRVVEVTEPDLCSLLAGYGPVPSAAERGGDDEAVILYPPAAAGRPRGAALTHASLTRSARRTATTVLHAGPGDVIMGCLPLFEVFGLTCALNAAILSGATLILLPRFDPASALEIIGRDKVTIFEGVPAMYAAMLNHPGSAEMDASPLGVCVSGGPAMPAEIMRRFEEMFGCMIRVGTPAGGAEMRVAGDSLAAAGIGSATNPR
jgi:long-chain acyl-CoA synthetase